MVVKLARDGANAGLVRGRPQRRGADAGGANLAVGQQAQEVPARFIVAHGSGQTGHGAKAGDIPRHIGSATRVGGAALNIDHRDRSLRRDAGYFAPQEFVEHDIADDEDFAAREGAEDFLKARRGEMHGSVNIFSARCQSGSEGYIIRGN